MSMEETEMKERLKVKDLGDFLAVGKVKVVSISDNSLCVETTMVDLMKNKDLKDKYVDVVYPDYYGTTIQID